MNESLIITFKNTFINFHNFLNFKHRQQCSLPLTLVYFIPVFLSTANDFSARIEFLQSYLVIYSVNSFKPFSYSQSEYIPNELFTNKGITTCYKGTSTIEGMYVTLPSIMWLPP